MRLKLLNACKLFHIDKDWLFKLISNEVSQCKYLVIFVVILLSLKQGLTVLLLFNLQLLKRILLKISLGLSLVVLLGMGILLLII